MMMNQNWVIKAFNELAPNELYAILRLRSEVFVVEQNCVFLDMDNKDQQCHHLMGIQDGKLVAYTRLAPPGHIYEQPSIGRVVTAPEVRNSGIGKILMKQSINGIIQLYGSQPIKIGAQLYLKKFYESFGFQQISDVYLEDGIEHIYMLKTN
ncbi:GNAT family N-acetyltransferase [Chitinophagaceae bacterium LB-8]|uniref:GNAT family N-acetyltransferase n=1 Tax=Paraflavisolibacter caeni TaxID=2982496 RepID=A0A9X3B7K2_9BACT|nr:GNAT family N-acetyltransferase [Paraflavisolibacter caeni]MCU7549350.1 GNAT family N-acetyltransferase [Paraflavisolibacter caeni]